MGYAERIAKIEEKLAEVQEMINTLSPPEEINKAQSELVDIISEIERAISERS